MNYLFFIFLMLAIITAISNTHADSLILKDGSQLNGEVIKKEKGSLIFKTSYAGTIKIKWEQIKTLETNKPIQIMLTTDEIISTHLLENVAQIINQTVSEETKKRIFNTQNVRYINPEPWQLNQGYKVAANANFSVKVQQGNTDKSELEIDGNLEFRDTDDRYTFAGQIENDHTKDQKTADNWKLSGKYDYFVSKKRYYGLELSFERDTFTDLRLRTTLGPHIGHQFFESTPINLRAELGLSKVYEDFIEVEDDDYIAMNWFINYEQFFFNNFTQFYHKQNGIWNLENTNKITLNSWTGFRFPLRYGIVASAELELEYDSLPSESIHQSDRTYRLKLGYQW